MFYAPSMASPKVDEDDLADLLAQRRRLSNDDLDDSELADMISRIKPVVRGGEQMFVINVDDPYENYLCRPDHCGEPVSDLTMLCSIVTLHPFGDYCYNFCPTPADVFAMIPPELAASARFFEIIGPESEDEFDRQMPAMQRRFHVATTALYA